MSPEIFTKLKKSIIYVSSIKPSKAGSLPLFKILCMECYKMTKTLPAEERFNMVQQIRRAALSVHLNIAEGSSGKSLPERKRFYEIARSSVIEIDAALDIAS